MKILIDMNLSPDWVHVFKKYDIESIHWSMIGDPRAIDREIMDWANSNEYIVFFPLSHPQRRNETANIMGARHAPRRKLNRLLEQCHPFTSPPIPKQQGLSPIYRSRAIASIYCR